jgi:hypothetical protein
MLVTRLIQSLCSDEYVLSILQKILNHVGGMSTLLSVYRVVITDIQVLYRIYIELQILSSQPSRWCVMVTDMEWQFMTADKQINKCAPSSTIFAMHACPVNALSILA